MKKRFVGVHLCIVWMVLLVVSGCGGGGAASPAEGTQTFTLTSTPTPTPTVLAGAVATPTLQPSPNPLCTNLELEIDYQQEQQAEAFYARMTANGLIPLTVDTNQTPPRLQGKGEAQVGGGGKAGNCEFVYTGSLEYDLQGELLLDRQPPVIALSGRRGTRDLSAAGSGCYGGLLAPVFTDEVPLFEIEYRDGAVLEYQFEVPTFHGEAVWTLYFRCP